MSFISGGGSEEGNSNGSVGSKDSCKRDPSKEDELDSARAEMNQVREENARLKMMLEKIETEYKSLQMRFTDIYQQGAKKKITTEEPELISLRLGRFPSEIKNDKTRENEEYTDGFSLGLDCDFGRTKSDTIQVKSASPENSSKDELGEAGKGLKTIRNEDEEPTQQTSVKRARVSVRARCDTPTMNDGCQWRKYGQKISKGNPCPRAYYRCTVAPFCPVRKQIQRCAQDMSILITTYEGTHNHPLSVTATAMASTTSAAASMLLSGSSTTQRGPTNIHVNPLDYARSKPFYVPNSPTPAYPTITLDLTNSTPSPHFNMNTTNSNLRFPSQNLNFSSSSETTSVPSLWGGGYLNYGTLSNESKTNRPSLHHFYQPSSEMNNQVGSQQPLAETLTKALTLDPSFRSVIAAAISSMVGATGDSQMGHNRGESFDKNLN